MVRVVSRIVLLIVCAMFLFSFLPLTSAGNVSVNSNFTYLTPVTLTLGLGIHNSSVKVLNTTWAVFNGTDQISIPDADQLSPVTYRNITTISFWVYMNNFTFKGHKDTQGYTNYLGKAVGGNNEYYFRMYNDSGADSAQTRPCRMSFYAFNLSGGLGQGSFFQDNSTLTSCPTLNNTWINVVGQINGTSTLIWKNGVFRDSDPLDGFGINPGNGNSTFYVGADLNTPVAEIGNFQGNIADLRIWNVTLSKVDIELINNSGINSNTNLNDSFLVARYELNENNGTKVYDTISGNNGTFLSGLWANDAIYRNLSNLTDYTINNINGLLTVNSTYLYNWVVVEWNYKLANSVVSTAGVSCQTAVSVFGSYPVLIGLIGTIFFIGLIVMLLFGFLSVRAGFEIKMEYVIAFFLSLVAIAILIIVAIVILSTLCISL